MFTYIFSLKLTFFFLQFSYSIRVSFVPFLHFVVRGQDGNQFNSLRVLKTTHEVEHMFADIFIVNVKIFVTCLP
jgi:hypothetical protein